MYWSTLFVALFTFYALYQLFKYLARKISTHLPPGPIGLPLIGYLPFLRKEPHKVLAELSKKYGPVYGLYLGQVYTVILGDYNTIKEAFTRDAASDRNPLLFSFFIDGVGFTASNGKEWEHQRRFCIQAFRKLGLGKGPWEILIKEEVKDFTEMLSKHQGKPIDISSLLSSSVSSNIMSLLIGRKLQRGKDDELINLLIEFIDISFQYAGAVSFTTMMPWLRKFMEYFNIAGYHNAAKVVSRFCCFVRNEVKRHETSTEAKDVKDFLNMYLDKLNGITSTETEKHYFTDLLLVGNLKVLFFGGSVSISSSLLSLFLIVASYPDIQRKIHEELDSVIGSDDQVMYDDRRKFPYTLSVMMEMQRMATIVPLIPRRVQDDFIIKGYTIPKGTQIAANIWAVHNDPTLWEEPEKFCPERFLSGNKQHPLKADGLVAFSIGKRQCPGEDIAWMEIFLYFVAIMKKFKVIPPEGKQITFVSEYGIVSRLKSHQMCFVSRE